MQRDKLDNWRRTHYSIEITPEMNGKSVTIFGWVYTIRDLGRIKFILLSDIKGAIQITIPLRDVESKLAAKVADLQKQYVVGIRGKVKKSEKADRGVEIIPEEIKILNTAQHPLALDPTGRMPADIDVRLNARILDLRRRESQSIFRVNHYILRYFREYFDKEDFTEVQTPKIIATATEGGSSLFPVLYFDREAFLAQSPQLYKEELTSVFEKVFEIGPYFRAEESRTTRHISEFISVDIEQSFATADDVMQTLEEMIQYTLHNLSDKCKEILDLLKIKIEPPSLPLPRRTYDEILNVLHERNVEIKWGEDIPTPALRVLKEIYPKEFYFIVDWPTKLKPFYISPKEAKPEISEAFDFMYSWMELASGGTRVHNKNLLIERLRDQGLNPESFEHHLKVFDWGMPPHAGWGFGLSRFLMILIEKENVKECILFPRDRDRLIP